MTTRTHIKGLVIDAKPDKNAVFVMQPDGSAVIVKSDEKKFNMLLNGMEQGDWFCCSGEVATGGNAATFTAMADVSPGEEIITEKDVRFDCWNNHCDGVYDIGFCFSAPMQKWERITDAYGRSVGAVAADKIRSQQV